MLPDVHMEPQKKYRRKLGSRNVLLKIKQKNRVTEVSSWHFTWELPLLMTTDLSEDQSFQSGQINVSHQLCP